jgi:hypothetical protein
LIVVARRRIDYDKRQAIALAAFAVGSLARVLYALLLPNH